MERSTTEWEKIWLGDIDAESPGVRVQLGEGVPQAGSGWIQARTNRRGASCACEGKYIASVTAIVTSWRGDGGQGRVGASNTSASRYVTCSLSFASDDRLFPNNAQLYTSLPPPGHPLTKDVFSCPRGIVPEVLVSFLRASNGKSSPCRLRESLRPWWSNMFSSVESNTLFDLSSKKRTRKGEVLTRPSGSVESIAELGIRGMGMESKQTPA